MSSSASTKDVALLPWHRWRQRRRIDVAARAVGPNRPWAEAEMWRVHVVLAAGILLDLLIRLSQRPRARVGERARVVLRILDQHLDVDVVVVGPRPALHDVHRSEER